MAVFNLLWLYLIYRRHRRSTWLVVLRFRSGSWLYVGYYRDRRYTTARILTSSGRTLTGSTVWGDLISGYRWSKKSGLASGVRSDRYRQRKHRALANHYRKKNKKRHLSGSARKPRGSPEGGEGRPPLYLASDTVYYYI